MLKCNQCLGVFYLFNNIFHIMFANVYSSGGTQGILPLIKTKSKIKWRPFSEERTQGPNQIPSAVVLLKKPLHGGFGYFFSTGT